ncbi:MAG: hypothetical protein FWC64_08715 [Treponema sp.]|nr:hypothetical protein [Treponema sp.]
MKKALLSFALTIGVCSMAFSLHETWFSVGHERAFLVETYRFHGNTIDTSTALRGVNASTYRFFTDRTGIFVHGSLLFPTSGWVWDNDGMSNIDFTLHAMNMQIGLIMGVAFRFDFTDDFKSYLGIGLNYVTAIASYFGQGGGNVSYDRFTRTLGIGADVGLKVDVTDRFFVRLGSIVTFDFAKHTSLDIFSGTERTSSHSGWNESFFMLGLRPYISLGINLFWIADENNRLRLATGKP